MHDRKIQDPGGRESQSRKGNRLSAASSLYLLQHARNPVDWYPWGEEALRAAREQDRPIFLSSGYASCHWCHVMEREVFESEEIAAVLNRNFVAVKVDREESPEIDAVYMQAVQHLTGGGGWPLSVFLTPDLRPFFGGTYIPPARFMELLERIDDWWRTRRSELDVLAGDLVGRLKVDSGSVPPAGGRLDRATLADAVRQAQVHFDAAHGGMSGPMKFPVPVRWRFLLHWWCENGDPAARGMLTRTLESMAAGGLRDHVGAGFHRYTVDPHWTVPHFEKMLYDNAQLASLYLEAGMALRRDDFIAVGLDTLGFMADELSDESGPCYASIDADSQDGEEGAFYVWTRSQVIDAAGPRDGPLLADLLGISAAGNAGHGTSVVTRRVDPAVLAERHQRSMADVADLFDRHREALRRFRSERAKPRLDRKIITSWNGLAMSAFVRGYAADGETAWLDRARSIAAYLRRAHRDAGGSLSRASNDGIPVGMAVLDDHALLAQGLLDIYEMTGQTDMLDWARELLETMCERFAGSDGAWYASVDADTPMGRRLDLFDGAIPSGGSSAVTALLKFSELTGEDHWREYACRQIAAQTSLIRKAGLEMAGWLSAALHCSIPGQNEASCRSSRACAGQDVFEGGGGRIDARGQ